MEKNWAKTASRVYRKDGTIQFDTQNVEMGTPIAYRRYMVEWAKECMMKGWVANIEVENDKETQLLVNRVKVVYIDGSAEELELLNG